jgi:hypothetical protein
LRVRHNNNAHIGSSLQIQRFNRTHHAAAPCEATPLQVVCFLEPYLLRTENQFNSEFMAGSAQTSTLLRKISNEFKSNLFLSSSFFGLSLLVSLSPDLAAAAACASFIILFLFRVLSAAAAAAAAQCKPNGQ